MPLYEFECDGCGERFEELVSADASVTCPGCGSADIDKLMSAFAVGGGGSAPELPPACGGCPDSTTCGRS